jgi:hypothetical protein
MANLLIICSPTGKSGLIVCLDVSDLLPHVPIMDDVIVEVIELNLGLVQFSPVSERLVSL